jgi:hypothetical protein
MRIPQIPNPEYEKAEGYCNGLPYNTELASSAGCSIHFWVGLDTTSADLNMALHKARCARDIVSATYSIGSPAGFWADQDIN